VAVFLSGGHELQVRFVNYVSGTQYNFGGYVIAFFDAGALVLPS